MDRIIPKTTWYSRDWRSSFFFKAEGVTGNPWGFFPNVRGSMGSIWAMKENVGFLEYIRDYTTQLCGDLLVDLPFLSCWSVFAFFFVSNVRKEARRKTAKLRPEQTGASQGTSIESWKLKELFFLFSWLICWPSPQSRGSLKLLDSSRHVLNERIAG